MTLHVCVLGIDGSGKSTVVAALPNILAAESRVVAGSAGEQFLVLSPDEDLLAPRFNPTGLPIAVRLSRRLKSVAKRFANHPKLYSTFKLSQMLSQDSASQSLAQHYLPSIFVSDGNAVLSTMARAANYLRAASSSDVSDMLAPDEDDLRAVFANIFDGVELPEESSRKLPSLRIAKLIYKFNQLFRLRAAWLPDVVIFLDLPPEVALSRIKSRGQKIDRHENLADLTQARSMYLETLRAFQRYNAGKRVHCVCVHDLSIGETLRAVMQRTRPDLLSAGGVDKTSLTPLGTTSLADDSIRRKTLNFNYLFHYLLPKWFAGAWREPTFFLSPLGRLFLKEGYSAGVMRAIYDRDEKQYGALDQVFLEYSLHRAVYDRLQILTKTIKGELQSKLSTGRDLRIFTAPSGYAYDLFRPLEEIASNDAGAMKRVHLIAADLDPYGVLNEELAERARRLGIQFTFLRGDITSEVMRGQLEEWSPFDLALFIGLSSWLSKPKTLSHLNWLHEHMAQDGRLFTDCFTPEAYALSGHYIGYKANYYTPEVYRAILDYCGFDGLHTDMESGRDGINHVLVASPRVSPTSKRTEDGA
jgi:Thymidylate kinase